MLCAGHGQQGHDVTRPLSPAQSFSHLITPTSWHFTAGPLSFGSGSQTPGLLYPSFYVGAVDA